MSQADLWTMIQPVKANKPTAASSKAKTKKTESVEYTVKDIPSSMLHDYNHRLVSLLRTYLGTREPFTELTIEECQTIFDLAFPEVKMTVEKGDLWHTMVCTSLCECPSDPHGISTAHCA